MTSLIQIAGIRDLEEALMLVDCGVTRLGFPFRIPSQEEDLSEDQAARIVRSLPPSARGVLITYLEDPAEIADLSRRLGTPIVQLHGDISPDAASRLKAHAPELRLVKSLIVGGDCLSDLRLSIHDFSAHVEAFIMDTYDPDTGASGATGKTHDWNISRKLVEHSPCPIILAGGLNPENVRRAILEVRPAGVDVHTGVEGPDGRKDRDLVREFVSRAREGFAEI